MILLAACSDAGTGLPLGQWPGGITSQFAFVSRDRIYVAVSSDEPLRAIARIPDTLGLPGATSTVAWSPGADTLALSLWIPYGVGSKTITWLIDPTGKRPPPPPAITPDYESGPMWAPDGRFASCRLLTIGGSSTFYIVVGGTPVLRECSGRFDIFPDGQSLAVTRVMARRDSFPIVGGYAFTIYTLGLYAVPLADTGAARVLAVDTVVASGCLENCAPPPSLNPAISPAGNQIAFVRGSSLSGGTSIWVVAPDGTGLRPLTAGPNDAGPPAWSRDGRWVMFRRGTQEMVATQFDGSASLRLLQVADTIGAFGWSRR